MKPILTLHLNNYQRSRLALACIAALIATWMNAEASAQTYEATILNKEGIFSPASTIHDFDKDGDLDVVILNRTSGSVAVGEWLENDGAGKFLRREIFQGLVVPADFDAGDMDQDGDIDYVIADKSELVWFERQDNGAFLKHSIEDSIEITQAAVGDMNGDGDLDIISVGSSSREVKLYDNDGFQNFAGAVINITPATSIAVETEDLDGDADLDVVIGGAKPRVLFNNGLAVFDSTLGLFETLVFPGGNLAISDLNNDGKKDILMIGAGLRFYDANKGFQATIIDQDGTDFGGDIIVADFDGNGLKDIVRQHLNNDYLAILYQDANLVFRKVFLDRAWQTSAASKMSSGDLDGDGDLDLVFPENSSVDKDLAWFENIGGALYRHSFYGILREAQIPKIGDLDGDGDLDIALTATEDRNLIWHENRGGEGYVEWIVRDGMNAPYDLELADINGDGRLDIVATDRDENSLYWYRNDLPRWEQFLVSDSLNEPLGCAVGDLNSDAKMDILASSSSDSTVLIYVNDGAGNFSGRILDHALPNPREIETADLDKDGDFDVVAVSSAKEASVVVYMNNDNLSFTKRILFSEAHGYDLEIGDWNGDGMPDLVASFFVVSGGSNLDVALFRNDGVGGFSFSPLLERSEFSLAIKLADVDNDGDLDLLYARPSSRGQIFLNDNGRLGTAIVLTEPGTDNITGFDAGDLNHDGVLDIVSAQPQKGNLVLYTGSLPSGIEETHDAVNPSGFFLSQNFPNPFNPRTIIQYRLSAPTHVELKIYNHAGQEIETLIDQVQGKGEYKIAWSGANSEGEQVASGVYLYRLQAGSFVRIRKMILLR